jgi:hypothetical protein
MSDSWPTILDPTIPGFYKYDWFNAPPGLVKASTELHEAMHRYVCEVTIQLSPLLEAIYLARGWKVPKPFIVYFYLPPKGKLGIPTRTLYAQRLQS